MLIECTIPELDNIVKVGDAKYHFRRKSMTRDTPMLCEVGDTTHAAVILMMDGFKAVREDLLAQVAEVDGEGGAGDDGGAGDGDSKPPASRYETMTYEEVVAEYKLRLGRDPHPQAKYETLVKRLIEADQA